MAEEIADITIPRAPATWPTNPTRTVPTMFATSPATV